MPWAPDYLTLAEAKDFERIDLADTADDVELSMWITAASRAIDDTTNRQFGAVDDPTEFTYTANDIYYNPARDVWVLDVDDFTDATDAVVVADGTTVTMGVPEERNAVAKGKTYTRIVFPVDTWLYIPAEVGITLAGWGWPAVPAAVKGAAKLQVSRWAARRDSPFGVAGSPEKGNELRLLAKLDPDVAVMLKSVTRPERPR
jgi:hypothetical protein